MSVNPPINPIVSEIREAKSAVLGRMIIDYDNIINSLTNLLLQKDREIEDLKKLLKDIPSNKEK